MIRSTLQTYDPGCPVFRVDLSRYESCIMVRERAGKRPFRAERGCCHTSLLEAS